MIRVGSPFIIQTLNFTSQTTNIRLRLYCFQKGPYYRRQELKKKKIAVCLLLQQRTSSRTRQWVHPLNQRRKQQGEYYNLVQELALDSRRYHNYFRMSPAPLEEVLSYVGQDLCKQTTTYREPIEAKQRLAVTLR